MRVHTLTEIDIDTGQVVREEGYDYHGPVALAIGWLSGMGTQGMRNDEAVAGGYGQAGANVTAATNPILERMARGFGGYSPIQQSQMQTRAQLTGGATAGRAAEDARLRAMRSGNMAGVNALTGAAAEGTARGVGSTVQDVQAQSANLAAKQQESALGQLGQEYGEDTRAQMQAQALVPDYMKAITGANETGWLQNTMGVLGTIGKLGGAKNGPLSYIG